MLYWPAFHTRFGISAFLVALLLTAAVDAAETDKLDDLIARAGAEQQIDALPAMQDAAASELQRLASEIRKRGEDPTLVLSARQRLIDGLSASGKLEKSGDTLESLRMLVRTAALASSLTELEGQKPEKLTPLGKVTESLYARMVRVGAAKLFGDIAYTVKPGERLIFRMFASDKGRLSAFELVGDNKRHTGEWRQSVLPEVGQTLRSALSKAAAVDGGKGTSSPAFALVIGPGPDDGTAGKTAEELALGGILLVAAEARTRDRPLLGVPAIAERDLAGEPVAAMLIDIRTRSVIQQWKTSTALPKIVDVALKQAKEVAGDLDDRRLTPLIVQDFHRKLVPVTQRAEPDFVAVPDSRKAANVDGSGADVVEPWFALALSGKLGEEWGEYSIHGSDRKVWLRPGDVRTYVEYPAELQRTGILAKVSGRLFGTDSPPHARLKTSTKLRSRPYLAAAVLETLPTATKIEVLHRAATSAESNDTLEGSQRKPAAKKLIDRPSWAFVRAGQAIGWIETGSLSAAEAPLSTPSDAEPGIATGMSRGKLQQQKSGQ